MIDFETVKSELNQKFSFLPSHPCMIDDQWIILDSAKKEIGCYTESTHTISQCDNLSDETQEEVIDAFNNFISSPVYMLYRSNKLIYELISQPEFDITCASDLYRNLIVGAAIVLYGSDMGIKYSHAFLTWLDSTDFYQAPASAKYHDSYPGGLLQHSLSVAYHITELIHVSSFQSVNLESAVLVALVHDLCKINLYQPYIRNVKNEESGSWEQIQAYKYKDAMIPLGHGVASLYIVQKFFKLNLEQALAIRWHMGRWNLCDGESAEYHVAAKTYPLVYMLQFADTLSIKLY